MAPWKSSWPANVWIGTSVENGAWAQRRLPILSEIPAVVRFVSAEPLLESFSVADYSVDWLIAGGESGRGHRTLDPSHIRALRDDCQRNDVAFFFKQWGGRTPKQQGRELDALDNNVRLTAESRGLAITSFYLDMVAKGREMAPHTRYGKELPVEFERNWQGLGSLEMDDITPDVIQFFPQFGNQPVAIALSIWCEHAVDAFHRACSAYQLDYLLY